MELDVFFFAFKDEQEEVVKTDAIKIKEEYEKLNNEISEYSKLTYPTVTLSDDNPFVYKTEDEIIDILQNKSGVIYFGFSSCPWCRTMLPILEEAAKETKIQEISYLDIQNIRDVLELDENNKVITKEKGTEDYYKILELMSDVLDDYVLTSEDNKEVNTNEKRLYAPTVVVVVNGNIESIHVGTLDSQESGFDTLSEEQTKELKEIYVTMLEKLTQNVCEEGC